MMDLRNKKVLVTGGPGFIASHLCRRLVREGASLYVLTRYNSIIDNVRLAGLWGQLIPVEADIRNPDSLAQLRTIRPEIIYHFAAYNHVGDSFLHVAEAIDSNGKGSVNVLEAYGDYERFIYISSSEVYGRQEAVPFHEGATPFPVSPYAVGKYAGELYARMKWAVEGKPIVVLRPFNAFGPYQSPRAVVAEIIINCLLGQEVLATEGKQTRDFSFVEDLVDAFVLAAGRDEAVGEVINVGSGREIAIRDLIGVIHGMTRSSSRVRIGALPYRPTEIWRMCAANEKAQRLLGWRPRVGFERGLEITIDWYGRFIKEFMDPASALCRLGL
ncbi:MAG: GDP-mannose 4,6-dehydratase [Deltaproteobacteria bacterium]|nr:GDP-mannose 4,6-dehydratase [Deltaproteobacteria bacterium]